MDGMQSNCSDGSLAPKTETIKVADSLFHDGSTRAAGISQEKENRKDHGLGWLPERRALEQDSGEGKGKAFQGGDMNQRLEGPKSLSHFLSGGSWCLLGVPATS